MPNERVFPERIAFAGQPDSIFVPYVQGNLPAGFNGNVNYRPNGNGQHLAYDRNPTAVVFRVGGAMPVQVVAPPPPRPPPPPPAPAPPAGFIGGPHIWPQGYPAPIPLAAYNPPPPPPAARVVQAPPPMRFEEAIAYGQALQRNAPIPMAAQVAPPAPQVYPEQFWGEDRLVRQSYATVIEDYYDAKKRDTVRYFLGPH